MNTEKKKTRAELKLETRDRILKAAKTHFLEKGYFQTTMRDIASSAEIASGTTFAHFDDKATLLAAIIFKDTNQLLEDRIKPSGDTPLLEYLESHARLFFYYHTLNRPLTIALVKVNPLLEGPWGKKILSNFEEARERLENKLLSEQKVGCISSEADCGSLATNLIMNYQIVLLYGLRANLSLEQMSGFFLKLACNLLVCYLTEKSEIVKNALVSSEIKSIQENIFTTDI